jgi:hypothetical protein
LPLGASVECSNFGLSPFLYLFSARQKNNLTNLGLSCTLAL